MKKLLLWNELVFKIQDSKVYWSHKEGEITFPPMHVMYTYKHKTKHDKDKRLKQKYKIKLIHTQSYIKHHVPPVVMDVKTV